MMQWVPASPLGAGKGKGKGGARGSSSLWSGAGVPGPQGKVKPNGAVFRSGAAEAQWGLQKGPNFNPFAVLSDGWSFPPLGKGKAMGTNHGAKGQQLAGDTPAAFTKWLSKSARRALRRQMAQNVGDAKDNQDAKPKKPAAISPFVAPVAQSAACQKEEANHTKNQEVHGLQGAKDAVTRMLRGLGTLGKSTAQLVEEGEKDVEKAEQRVAAARAALQEAEDALRAGELKLLEARAQHDAELPPVAALAAHFFQCLGMTSEAVASLSCAVAEHVARKQDPASTPCAAMAPPEQEVSVQVSQPQAAPPDDVVMEAAVARGTKAPPVGEGDEALAPKKAKAKACEPPDAMSGPTLEASAAMSAAEAPFAKCTSTSPFAGAAGGAAAVKAMLSTPPTLSPPLKVSSPFIEGQGESPTPAASVSPFKKADEEAMKRKAEEEKKNRVSLLKKAFERGAKRDRSRSQDRQQAEREPPAAEKNEEGADSTERSGASEVPTPTGVRQETQEAALSV